MSAKIYRAPDWITAPNIWGLPDDVDYQELENKYKADVADVLKKGNPHSGEYVGKIVSFRVADGCAEYMVKSMEPLELVHLPLMDAYEAPHVDLMVADRIKSLILAEERLTAYNNRIPKHGDVDKVIAEHGTETTSMSQEEIDAVYDPKNHYKKGTMHITWKCVNYLIPVYSHKHNYKHEIYKYLCNNFKVI